MKNQRGFALVLTLIITALLVALVVEFITDVYVDTTSRQNFVDAQKASLIADSGITGATALMQWNLNSQSYTSLQDSWLQPIKLTEGDGTLTITIEEESGKLNINDIAGQNGTFNTFQHDAAFRLFQEFSLPADQLVNSIADWRSETDTPHAGGAKTSWYSSLNPPYMAPNNNFLTVEELNLVKGFNTDLVNKLKPFITVYSDNQMMALININTAPKEVLIALDDSISEGVADDIINYRRITPFTTVSDIANVPGMSSIGTALQGHISVKGTIFRITAVAQVNETTRTVEAVINFAAGVPVTTYWREY
ncbi:MAG: type II secretion system minor pseudopilin GspK [Desulfuromonadales bacterium]|nr:type II secretion system minor pseudopilin GspK [Desulfuromonadales bacterium]